MKYIKLFESMTEVEVEKICKNHGIENWSINKDGLVDVDGDVNLAFRDLTKLPLQFGRVTGGFYCHINKLTTLEGAPTEIGDGFFCDDNRLTTLEGAPKEVRGNFECQWNVLTTLEGAPKEVRGNFYCHHNYLTTLEGAPTEVDDHFYCSHNDLTTLEGAPKEVRGGFYCQFNKLTTLEGAPTEVGGNFWCFNNKLTTLKWAPEYVDGEVIILPNDNLPKEFLDFLRLNNNDLQKYILKWQKDYAIWRKDGSFNQSNFIHMMEAAQDELQNIKFPK